jgi:hypothetical protein
LSMTRLPRFVDFENIMQNEPADNPSGIVEDELVEDGNTEGNDPPPTQSPDETKEPTDSSDSDSTDITDDEPEGSEAESDAEKKNPVTQYVDSSNIDILIGMGPHGRVSNYHVGTAKEFKQALDVFVRVVDLESPSRRYKSLEESNIAGYSGCLRTERILLLSCHDEDVAMSVAKSIAYEANVPRKQLVTIDESEQNGYNFLHLIDALAGPRKKRKAEPGRPAALCVWDADTTSNNEISGGILNSLLSKNSRVEQYKCWLRERDLFLICIVPPERVQKYNDSRSGTLQSLKIDFLNPLLEQHDESQYENWAVTIRGQRSAGRWSDNDVDFYREISFHVRNGKLAEAIQKRMGCDLPDTVRVEDLFNREDPIVDTILYCATYFGNLSPQDFHYLVELFLADTTEEVTRRVTRRQDGSDQIVEVIESVPLVNRWRRSADALLRRCKVANLKNEDGKRVIDFQDGLRPRLAQYIRNENYFFYEANFVFLKQQGLLFSPKRLIAEGARQLLVEVARHYAPGEVARWLYEIVHEFEEMAQAADRLKELTPRFQLLPDLRVKAARRFVAHGLSRVLIRLDQEDDEELSEAVRLFWQKLVQSHHQWFLELLRRMGDSTPAETVKWLKQLLDQGSDLIRLQARAYLVAYLVHKESAVYATLKEVMQWSKSSRSGRIAQEVLIVYCAETNRKLAQQDYGQWPNSHPLFGFETRAEAEECLELLVSWVCTAAAEVDEDNALFIVADLFAGWYFILSDAADGSGEANSTGTELTAHIVRDLLFQRLARHSPRAQRTALTAIWDRLRSDILEKVIHLDEFVNNITFSASPSAEFLSDAAMARRNLLDARTSLSELRKAFIEWAAKTTPA